MRLKLKVIRNFIIVFACFPFLLLHAQNDAFIDSLERAVNKSTGSERVDLMLRLANELGYKNYRESVDQYTKQSLSLIEQALDLSRQISYRKGEAASYRSLGFYNMFRKKYADANRYFTKSLEISQQDDDKTDILNSYMAFLYLKVRMADFADALKYVEITYKIAENSDNLSRLNDILIYYGKICKSIGLTDKEKEAYFRRLDICSKLKLNAADIYILLGRFFVDHGEYRPSIACFRKADSAIAVRNDMVGLEHPDRCFLRAKQTGNIARAFRLWGFYDSALVYHRKTMMQFDLCEWKKSTADKANQEEGIGIIYTQWGILDSATYYFERSMANRQGDWLGQGFCYDGLGYISWLMGDHKSAVNYYMKAIEVKIKCKPLGDEPHRTFSLKEGLSISHLRLGMVYADWKMPEMAMEEFNISLKLCREIGFAAGETDAMISIGNLDLQLGRYDEAGKQIADAYLRCRKAGDLPGQAVVLKNHGDLFVKKGELPRGLEYYRNAEKIQEKAGNPVEMAEISFRIGKTLFLIGDAARGEKEIQKSLRQAEKIRISSLIMNCNEYLAEIYEKEGRPKDALKYLQVSFAIRDSLFNRTTAFLLADTRKNNESKKLQLQLAVLLQSKKLKELEYHDWRNRLAGIAGLGILLILFAGIMVGNNRMRRKYNAMQLQQRLIRARLNPAFIGCSLNDIKGFVETSETVRAVTYLSDFARYIQHVMQGSRAESISFSKETALLQSYLNLKKSVFGDRFDFSIHIDQNVDQDELRIRPFHIHAAVEKAVERATDGKSRQGLVIINVAEIYRSVLVTIRDNGNSETGMERLISPEGDQQWNVVTIEIPVK